MSEVLDKLKRIKSGAVPGADGTALLYLSVGLIGEAIDHIEALEAGNARLRAQLNVIANTYGDAAVLRAMASGKVKLERGVDGGIVGFAGDVSEYPLKGAVEAFSHSLESYNQYTAQDDIAKLSHDAGRQGETD